MNLMKIKDQLVSIKYNHGHNIMRIFDALPNVLFTTNGTKVDYY